ncbi:MAG: T9SS type A sorting domain-containing protein [Bacteroidales bacterium]
MKNSKFTSINTQKVAPSHHVSNITFITIFFALILFNGVNNKSHAQTPAIEWQKCLGGTAIDYANSIHHTSDGGFIVAGKTYSNDGDVSWNHGGFGDSWLVKLNSSGDIEWQKCLGGTDNDEAKSIQQTSDGGYIVASGTKSNDGDVSGNHGATDTWLVKLNSLGDILWQKCLGGTSDDYAYCIQQTSDGGFIVTGETGSNDGDVSGYHEGGDFWVVKLNSSGDIEWQKCLGGTGWDWENSIQQTSDGGFIVAGSTYSNDGDVLGNHGATDYWVVKLNSLGDILWQKCLGGTIDDRACSIQQTSDGGFIVTGFTYSNDGDVSGNHGYSDYWVVKLTNEPERINEIENYNLLSIYPNPFTENAIITFDNPKNEKYRLFIIDITGKVVMEINEIYGNTVEIDGSNLSAGVYVFELTCDQCVLAGNEGEKLFRGRLVVE